MTENVQKNQNPIRAIVVATVAVIVIVGVIVVVIQRSANEQGVSAPTSTASPTATDESRDTAIGEGGMEGFASSPGTVLDKEMNGQEAIDALGDRVGAVAARNGMTEERFIRLLQTDSTAWVTRSGLIMYKDDFGKNDR